MTKFKKFLVSLLSCCVALVLVFAAGCTEPDDSSASSGSSATSSSESQTSSTESSSSSTDTASSSDSESTEATTSNSDSESSDSTESSSETESTDSTGDETGGDQEGDDYTLTSTTVYFVGDSTVCEFSDSYYLPRYGYGTQFYNYIDTSYVSVVNLALSGRSSKSFITEDNYDYLVNGSTEKGIEAIGEGDYLIIGFGHNDEKSEDSTRYTTPETNSANTEGTFQYYLYNYYIKVALDAGATPILCTPIVRYSSTADYTGSKAHITSDGDYAACILDLAEDYNITCVDLTSITKSAYSTMGEEAQWYHAHTGVTVSDDLSAREIKVTGSTTETVKVVANGRDDTHLNMYGAKMVAYEIASALQSARKTCALGYYVSDNIIAPTSDDLEAAYNSSYTYTPYDPFDPDNDVSENWTLSTSGWYGTVFGDTGTTSYSSNGYVVKDDTSTGTITVGQASSSGNKGKIGSTEGIAMAFMQLNYNQNFTMTVTAKVTTANSSTDSDSYAVSQSGFGLMLRDDIYIDAGKDTSILSNYVASGIYVTGSSALTSHAIYSRVDTALANSSSKNNISSAYKVGDTATLTIVRTGQNITCTVIYGGTTYSYIYYDFDLVAKDSAYMYLGLYATRGTVVEYSNITYNATGTAGDA